MYGHGSYNSQLGQGPHTPMPRPFPQQQQQLQLPGPPPLPPHFQQSPSAPPPSVGPPIYQYGRPAPPPAVRQVPPGAMPNLSQSYRHPRPTVQGSTPLPHLYSTDQQTVQLPSKLGAQNVHIPPSVLPHPPRILPPPPPTMYRAPLHLQSQHPGGVQDLQRIPPPPLPPPTSSFFTSTPLGSLVKSTGGTSHISSIASLTSPPPPSSPPPVPPSPPPPTSPLLSSKHHGFDSNLIISNEPSSSKLSTSGSVHKVVTTNGVSNNVPLGDGHLNEEGSLVGFRLSSRDSVMSELPPPPPKPTEEKIVQKIEDFCELIAEHGTGYEDMIRQNESKNPEFEFLFAGDPGSEANIAHEYFLWMKKTYILACKLNEGKSDSDLRPLVPSSMQPDHLVVAARSSPADSDMEMEDDITQSINDKLENHSTEGTNSGYDLIQNELDVKGHSYAQQISASEKVSFSGSPLPIKKGERVSDHYHLAFERPLSKVCCPVINSADEQPFASNFKKSATLLANDKSSSGASGAAESISPEENYSQLTKGGSPFRLLQDYDSGDEYACCLKDSLSVAATSLHRSSGSNLEICIGSKSPCKTEEGFQLQSGLAVSHIAANFPKDLGIEVKEAATTSIASGATGEHVDKHNKQASTGHAESPLAFQKKDALGGAFVEYVNAKFQKEYEEKSAKTASNSLNIDEFGRLVREGASDSDSDGPRSNGRQNKRGRSRNRSPIDRRRRSPRKRREKRSQSHSLSPRNWRSMSGSPRNRRSRSRSPRNRKTRSRSPRNRRSRSRSPRNRRSRSRSPRRRRSRSRSPTFRHFGEFGGESIRRDRCQIPECFDFRRGRCYRGASCRYRHHVSENGDGSKRHRSKQQYLEVPPIRENSNIHEDIKHNLTKAYNKEHNEVKISEIQHHRNLPLGTSVPTKDGNTYQTKEDSIRALESSSFYQDDQLIDSHTIKSGSSREASAKVLETQILEGDKEVIVTLNNKSCQGAMESQRPILVDAIPPYPVRDIDISKLHGDAAQKVTYLENSVIKQSLSHLSDPELQNAGCPPQQTDNSSISDSAPEQTSITSVNKIPFTEALPNRHHSPQLPLPPPLSHGVTAQPISQPPWDHNLTLKDTAFPLQSTSGDHLPSYMLPNQQSHFSMSPIASWTSLPPPPPGVSTQLQQSYLAPRNDFGSQIISRPYAAVLPTHSEVNDFQQRVYPLQESHRSLTHSEDFRSKPLPPYNSQIQQFVGPSLLRDHLTGLPMMGISGSSTFSQGDNQPLPTPFSQELPVNRMQPFPGENLPPGELLTSSSQVHSYLQQQQPPYGLQHPVAVSSSSRYPPDLQETNQSTRLPVFNGSISSNYYNPYASTLEQPPNSKFSSEAFRQEDTGHSGKYGTLFSLSHVDGQNIGSVGSGQATSSPNSPRAVGQNFPRSGGDQYDPLLDSIEPSTNLSKKFNNAQKWEPSSDSDIMLRHSGSNKPSDVEENNKKKVVGGVALATSVDDEEYGETADAEVGAVENGSPSNPIRAANIPAGELEIDQIKSPGKSKKNKESRSLKLFKVALADFVKEVLKPSWRQGNMSKEAFKTIVKKTVDKVSGAMKSHQIPKSRSKIDQYIDSQQRKLTKLVTGYVDKYVKM